MPPNVMETFLRDDIFKNIFERLPLFVCCCCCFLYFVVLVLLLFRICSFPVPLMQKQMYSNKKVIQLTPLSRSLFLSLFLSCSLSLWLWLVSFSLDVKLKRNPPLLWFAVYGVLMCLVVPFVVD